MAHKLLVTTISEEDAARVRATGAEVLAEYPEALLVRATPAQEQACAEAGMEAAPLPSPPLELAGARFQLDDALAAEAAEPIQPDPDRPAHFIVQLVGPIAPGWLAALTGNGVTVHGALAGYRLLAGMLPGQQESVAAEPFVEAVTPYRPAMKVSAALRSDVTGPELSRAALTRVDPGALAAREQVEVNLFEGADPAAVADRVRAGGGTVLTTGRRVVVAEVPPAAIVDLAADEAVEAVAPHAFPELSNDRAAELIGVPADLPAGTSELTGAGPLTGAGQVVGVADSGIDTGDPDRMHPDLQGRVTVVSSPNQRALFAEEPHDDGATDRHGHGTHVAGSIAGNGAAAEKAGSAVVPRGVAPEAHLHFTAISQRVTWKAEVDPEGVSRTSYGLFGNPTDIEDLLAPGYDAGVRIHTNSWGSSVGGYDGRARGLDQFLCDHRDLLVLFSAGNDGQDRNLDGQIDRSSIGSPGTAKNCLTVGASENARPAGSTPAPGWDGSWEAMAMPMPGGAIRRYPGYAKAGHVSDNPDGMALFSSRGPTDDGRVKPEVVAPGTNVLSARTSAYDGAYIGGGSQPLWGEVRPDTDPLAGHYCWSGGTSMSTPLVAGLAALIRQYLVEHRSHHQDAAAPSGALLKAFLVNGAEPLPGQYEAEVPPQVPNHVAGFGRVNLARSLAGTPAFSDDPALALASGETCRFQAWVGSGQAALRVTLTWTDPPSPPGHGVLQNRLYLRVVPPGGTPLDGDLTPYPTATNNTQQVTVPVPAGGPYEVRVHAVSVVARSATPPVRPGEVVQDFALVVSGAEELTRQSHG